MGNYIDVFGAINSQEPFNDIKINGSVKLIPDKLLVKFEMEED